MKIMKWLLIFFAAFWISEAHARIEATQDVRFYVNADPLHSQTCGEDGSLTCSPGNDSNDCLSKTTPCLTTDKAILKATFLYDWVGYTPTIIMAHGSSQNYAFNCGYGLVGTTLIKLVGDYNAPTAVNIIARNNNYAGITGDKCIMALFDFSISDNPSGNASGGLLAGQNSVMDLTSITWAGTTWNSGSALAEALNGGRMNLLGGDEHGNPTNTIASSNIGQGFQVNGKGIINFGMTVNIPNALTMQANQPFLVGLGGQFQGLNTTPATFTGYGSTHSTGKKCQLDMTYLANDVNANSIIPGSINCTPYGPF